LSWFSRVITILKGAGIVQWQDYAKTLKDVLELKGSPVSITYTDKDLSHLAKDRCAACDAFARARQGETIVLNRENSTCQGGTWHLGLGPAPQGKPRERLTRFLVEGEKLFCSPAAFYRINLEAPPSEDLTRNIVICPLEEAELRPDVVLFFVNPEQACRLMTLATWSTGISPRCSFVGSTCHMAVTYPLLKGEINVVLEDFTTRRRHDYVQDELIFSIPYHQFHSIVEAVPHCTAGTAPFVGFNEMA
jgi:uncharacterized protein (DUF169 family)